MSERRFLVVPQEWIAGQAFDTAEQALGEAAAKTRNDRKHRAVIEVHAVIEPDPQPAVVVTTFRSQDAEAEEARHAD